MLADVVGHEETPAAEMVIQVIRERLRNGTLIPGQRIVGSELASELGVSRIPVREAIHRLTGEGLIELDRNRSPRIRSVTAKDLADMLHLLGALGALGLRLASEQIRISADPGRELAALSKILDAIILSADDREAFEFNIRIQDFHSMLTVVLQNRYLSNALRSLHSEYFTRDLAPRLRRRHWAEIAENYRKIKELFLQGEGDTAAAEFQVHMNWIIGELFGENA